MVLMSGLGVSDDSFFTLQEAMLQRLAQMLINERQAAIALSQVNTVTNALHRISMMPSDITVLVATHVIRNI